MDIEKQLQDNLKAKITAIRIRVWTFLSEHGVSTRGNCTPEYLKGQHSIFCHEMGEYRIEDVLVRINEPDGITRSFKFGFIYTIKGTDIDITLFEISKDIGTDVAKLVDVIRNKEYKVC